MSLQRLTKGPNNWSLSEVVHAIVLLSHFHSLSSFVFSCGLTQELDPTSCLKFNRTPPKDSGNSSPPSRWGFAFRSNSTSSILGICQQFVWNKMQRNSEMIIVYFVFEQAKVDKKSVSMRWCRECAPYHKNRANVARRSWMIVSKRLKCRWVMHCR